jgi:hypothetical protein
MFVANDPFGSICMVSIMDILSDIKHELEVPDVRLAHHGEVLSYLGNDEEQITVSGARPMFYDSAQELDDLEATMAALSFTTKNQTQRLVSGRHPIDATPTLHHHVSSIESFANAEHGFAPRNNDDLEQASSSGPVSLSDKLSWYYGYCRDGPYSGWQLSCGTCSRWRNEDCIVEWRDKE